MYTGRTAESVRQVKGRGADIQNMALEWRPNGKAFPIGCDGISRYRKTVSIGTGRGVLREQNVKRSGNTGSARLLIQNL